MLSIYNIYCIYLWIWTFLYIFDYIKTSPFFATSFAVLFSIWSTVLSPISHKFPVEYKKGLILFEFFIAFINYKKFRRDNRIDFMSTFYTNILSFLIYGYFIGMRGKNFGEVYFVDIPNQKEFKLPLYKYVKLKILRFFNYSL